MKAEEAERLARSKPLSPQAIEQLQIVYELIEIAAKDGKFKITLDHLLRETRMILQNKGYSVAMSPVYAGHCVSWDNSFPSENKSVRAKKGYR